MSASRDIAKIAGEIVEEIFHALIACLTFTPAQTDFAALHGTGKATLRVQVSFKGNMGRNVEAMLADFASGQRRTLGTIGQRTFFT